MSRQVGKRKRGRDLPNCQKPGEISHNNVQSIQSVAEASTSLPPHGVPAFINEIQHLESAPIVNFDFRTRCLRDKFTKQHQEREQQQETTLKLLDQLTQQTENSHKLFQKWCEELQQVDIRAFIRVENSSIKAHENVMPILVNRKMPPNFPLTLAKLLTLDGDSINAMLEFYRIPTHGTVDERRKQLTSLLGINLP